jgi:adenine-specific DNA-methyltransferase
MTEQYEGRLELTWTNKPLRLLAHEDGSYEWIYPSDYRVAEVRLLHDLDVFGTVAKRRAADNLLIHGDALNALTSLARLQEFAAEFLGKVQLAYLDPPFNTQQTFLQYDDALEHSVWLTMMRDRLLQIRDLMAPSGTVWVHLDDTEVHRARCVLEELFGPENYIGTVVWEKKKKPSFLHGQMATITDFILVYGKNRSLAPPFLEGSSTEGKGIPFHNQGNAYGQLTFPSRAVAFALPNGRIPAQDMSTRTIRSELLDDVKVVDGFNANEFRMLGEWRFSQRSMDEMVAAGDTIKIAKIPFRPNLVRVETIGKKIANLFSFRTNGTPTNEDAKEESRLLFGKEFDTPKPEGLLSRIISCATEKGDIVLDCFLGSGTTAAVAHKLGRRWVGVEWSAENVKDYAVPRLRKVVEGKDSGGITDAVGWTGGGGFRTLDVARSMFQSDGGLVFLADWMTNGVLSEATAAQLGFSYEADPPFSGRKGRTRLAVVDGIVNEPVIRLLVGALPERERVVVCGTGIDTQARPILRELRPGSTLRKIPAALLDEYRSTRQPRNSDIADAQGAAEVAG